MYTQIYTNNQLIFLPINNKWNWEIDQYLRPDSAPLFKGSCTYVISTKSISSLEICFIGICGLCCVCVYLGECEIVKEKVRKCMRVYVPYDLQ